MQTSLDTDFLRTPDGQAADKVLRSCVHCGFCNATCPTYRLLGDELDGPRGRIYLLKQAMEGGPAGRSTQLHLDRCLSCRACETTCPSGVQYHKLLDIGREYVDARVPRPLPERVTRWAMRRVIPFRRRFASILGLARAIAPLLPGRMRKAIPARGRSRPWPVTDHERWMLVLPGCVQPAMAPNINAAAARVLDRIGIRLVEASGSACCGALSHHLGARDEGREFARKNIDAWWPHIEHGAEAVVMTASGCGSHVKEYGDLLAQDPDYAERARHVVSITRDIGEILADEDLAALATRHPSTVAFQSPCSLQHGQQLGGVVEGVLSRLGFQLTKVADPHLCCGSAGAYSLLQGKIGDSLRRDKIASLEQGAPERILTANIGCLAHLAQATALPVQHWIELVDGDDRDSKDT